MQKRVTLSIEEETYEDFQKFCEENDVILSRKVEKYMKGVLKEKKFK